ncbi:Maf family protein [Lacticaseibacillus mingshuiensis]|uniref:dTTP/UTP pyrophosphatase n=1 Tax=Lacticaseibacillus mingshuiensis TaxID=2799574 RepID=A0ABW4CFV9_9LACO|nr:Maf family protein [Lacticaseibacillus mingshuiensis]
MIVLASQSPRRIELLHRLFPTFTHVPAPINERALPLLAPAPYVRSLARAKGEAVRALYPGSLVIAADTMVVDGDRLVGKPANEAAAKSMLQAFSGRTHHVLTGLFATYRGQTVSAVVSTAVTFWPLTDQQLERYLATGEYRDKAGAYGIQGQGALLVKKIDGDFYNVVGLPISTLARLLAQLPTGY